MRSHHADSPSHADEAHAGDSLHAAVPDEPREVELDDDVLAARPLPRHEDASSKRDRGTVLVVGGSSETPGSVILAGTAALRAGAGRLQICTSPTTAAAIGVAVPEARVIPWPATVDDPAEEDLAATISRADAVLVGTGMLDTDRAHHLLRLVAASLGREASLLVDSASLRWCGDGTLLRRVADRTALMPNADEAATMLGREPTWVEEAPGEALGRLVGTHRAAVALRGPTSYISDPDDPATRWIERGGSTALATSGSGDVLAGMVAGLLARGADPSTALLWSVHLHARAAEGADLGLLARDLLLRIPVTFADVEREMRV